MILKKYYKIVAGLLQDCCKIVARFLNYIWMNNLYFSWFFSKIVTELATIM